MFEPLRFRWQSFWYNFQWGDYANFLNGIAAKASVFIPLIGYAVIFNDYITGYLSFKNLTGALETTLFINSSDRLRFIFVGLITLALANLTYRICRPYVVKIGETQTKYIDYMLQYATASTFLALHQGIKHSGFDPYTQEGKYYTDDWDLFWRESTWQRSGKGDLRAEDYSQKLAGYDLVNFNNAKARHQSLILSILIETYFREGRKRRPQLVCCLVIASIGYVFLLIPSLDLIAKVLQLTFLTS